MIAFALWVAFVQIWACVIGRLYTLGWKDQKPEGRIADVVLLCIYIVSGVALWGLL